MPSILDDLDNEQQAFVIGTSFHIQFYETADGDRYARQRDGSYIGRGKSFPSFVELLDQTSGPISAGQLYALVAIYHPLVTARISPDHEPVRMSRAEARAFIINQYVDITPFDLRLDAGQLSFTPLSERRALQFPPEQRIAVRARATGPRQATATVEITYEADGTLSEDELRARIKNDVGRLMGKHSDNRTEVVGVAVLAVDTPTIPAEREEAESAHFAE
jgi:hypothetical protein